MKKGDIYTSLQHPEKEVVITTIELNFGEKFVHYKVITPASHKSHKKGKRFTQSKKRFLRYYQKAHTYQSIISKHYNI